MTQTYTPPAPQPASAPGDEPDLPATPATTEDVLQWAHRAGWSVPSVGLARPHGQEAGYYGLIAAEATGTALTVALDNGQVFRLTAEQLTRPSDEPGQGYTLNPAGQRFTHAAADGPALCGHSADGEAASPDWAAVTCLDCRAAAPSRTPGDLDDLDRAMAERQARDALITASPWPLSLYEVMRRVDGEFRAAVPQALDQLTARGTAARVPGGAGAAPGWLIRPDR